jgi:hypothetical protein
MDTFKSGERVEVIESDAHSTVGQQGTVKSVSRDLVFVLLDIQSDLLRGVVIIDYVGDEARITTAFRPRELRHITTLSA